MMGTMIFFMVHFVIVKTKEGGMMYAGEDASQPEGIPSSEDSKTGRGISNCPYRGHLLRAQEPTGKGKTSSCTS